VYIITNNYRYADLTTDVSEHCLHAVDVDDELNAVIRQSDMVPFALYDLKLRNYKTKLMYYTTTIHVQNIKHPVICSCVL